MRTVRLVKTHGSLNEIFALDAAPDAWASDAGLREFVRRVCDRSSWTGGSDGIYLYDASGPDARAWFFNPDGSSAEFCGNGMRGLGRLILDLRGTDTEVVSSGGRDYTVHRAPSTPEGVRQVLLELPPLRFDDAALPAPFEDFTAVAVPNPHVIAIVGEYSEPDLIELGKRASEVFAEGANVSFLQSLDDTVLNDTVLNDTALNDTALNDTGGVAPEVFVRTFERGAGLTPSCGSGVVASRAAYSRVSGLDPAERLVVRNAGGVAAASIQVRDGAWYPVLEGNATIVYRAEVDLVGNQAGPVEFSVDENAAYETLDERNTARLKEHGIQTAHP
ncbi:MAG: diaminopimelate epimerase [Trebonia sp.]|nr:diaminopimelate epimerase [Trebonia sp.]